MHLRENPTSPAGYSGKKTWSKVSGRIDSIARIKAHGQTNDQNHKSHSERLQPLWDGVVVWIHDGQDANYQCCCANNLCGREIVTTL